MVPGRTVNFHSTQEVANLLHVHKNTVKRWLRFGLIAEPRHGKIAMQNHRLWSERDLERVKKFKEGNYRKKPRLKKAGSMKARRSKP
jgi:predicted site-specific integrase-resolvase